MRVQRPRRWRCHRGRQRNRLGSATGILRSRSIRSALRAVPPPKPVRSFGNFTKASLLEAAQASSKGGHAEVGRALQKHAGRQGSVLESYSTLGRLAERNEAGLRVLEEILGDPNGRTWVGDNVTEFFDSQGWVFDSETTENSWDVLSGRNSLWRGQGRDNVKD